MKQNCKNPEAIAKRMLWLAWQACGGPVGMGVFQNNPSATEEDVWKNVANSGDYARNTNKHGAFSADYVFGRMMKLYLRWSADSIEIPDGEPRRDYQSWCGKYPTYLSLYEAACASLEK